MNVDRFNRAALLILGLLLLAAGAAGLAAYTDMFGWSMTDRAVADTADRYTGAGGRWLGPLAAVAALVVLLLALRWLAAVLLSTDRVRTLALGPDGRGGEHTQLAGSAMEGAVRHQLEGYRGVTSAKVRLVGKANEPKMAVEVNTCERGELAALCERIERGVLADARRALGRDDLPVRLDLDVDRSRARVV
ncbi:alkaline shock response membrane anchor protein AmaP [Catellatospora bangladeshensis]|uniref:Alkaline shock response membrane anchor protein AmaP n=1 Tax=Catellatospora bangladeshensis TaxID=310355 RepID=A0A8J3JX24_9ACTN|nr:alkaline shock response membrane anchor protein AmaP [Catellatospora bangladeshensis]GIF84669.1 hypothetical protein Cba03nite_60180 [Catellatospora bangladeshensis]